MIENIEEFYNGNLSKYIPNEVVIRLDYLEISGSVIKDRQKCEYNFEILTFKMVIEFYRMHKNKNFDSVIKKDYVMPYIEWIKLKNFCDKRFEIFIKRRKK